MDICFFCLIVLILSLRKTTTIIITNNNTYYIVTHMGILKLERSGAVLGCEDAAEMRDEQADYGVGDLDHGTHHLNSPTLRSTGPGSRKCALEERVVGRGPCSGVTLQPQATCVK